jgi:integrase
VARAIDKLSDRTVKSKKAAGYHADGNGLYLCVKPTGAKSWILRYMIAGKAREMGLGGYPAIGLADARQRRDVERKRLVDGIDPIEAREAQRAANEVARAKRATFNDCVDRFLAAKSAEWKNAKHRAQWRATLETYAAPYFGELPVQAVDTDLVVKALSQIWLTKTETASRVRGRIESVLDWATASKMRTGDNPARWRGNLKELLPKPRKIAQVKHHPALPYRDVFAFLQLLAQSDATAARALETVIYTGLRTNETIGATWDEIDFTSKVWTVPASRMKMKRNAHRVPLSAPALRVLRKCYANRVNDYVFPSPSSTTARPRPLSNMAMLTLLKRMKRTDITPHGFRSTFRDWAAEQTNYPREVCEMALAHSVGTDTEKAYQRGDLLEKRARLMASWASYCNTKPNDAATVTPIKRKATT